MENPTLVTGRDSFLGNGVLNILTEAGRPVLSTATPPIPESLDGDRDPIEPWDPSSPLSTKNLFHSISNKYGEIPNIILSVGPESENPDFLATDLASVQEWTDRYFNGQLLFLREALGFILRQGYGQLHVLLFNESPTNPVLSACVDALKNLLRSLSHESRFESIIRGYDTDSGDSSLFLNFFREIYLEAPQQKKSKHWQTLKTKKGIFSSLPFFN